MKITKDTRVFVTGAASGIGRATAIALAEKGCRLFLTDINEDGLRKTCDIIADEGFPRPVSRTLDITDFAALQVFAEEIQQDGPMDIIMNIAGVALFARFEDMSHAHWQKVININLWGPLYIPIPFLYPIARNSGVTSQDMSHGRYRRMVEGFAAVFLEYSGQPLAQAAGHDHNLQVFDGREYGADYILVSGAGSKQDNVGWDDALFAAGRQSREHGYMRLEFFRDGRVLLPYPSLTHRDLMSWLRLDFCTKCEPFGSLGYR